jgi:uncharacterized phage-associated protein
MGAETATLPPKNRETRHGPPYPTLSVANWFVRRGLRDKKPVTPLKLMKLVYFAHGWFLGLGLYRDSPVRSLIDSTIEAWKFGPVPPDVYHAFKHFRANPISKPAIEQKRVYDDGVAEVRLMEPSIPESDRIANVLLERIWEVYGSYAANQLVELTHGEGTPWHTEWYKNGGMYLKGKDISNELIEEHFKTLLAS